MSNPPREFFENMVKPAYVGWLSDPLAEWKAKAAVGYANDLAERVFVHWDDLGDRTHVAGMTSVRHYRNHLRNTICSDFGLVWDVNDNTKHARLRREPREITTASQTGVGRIGWGEGRY